MRFTTFHLYDHLTGFGPHYLPVRVSSPRYRQMSFGSHLTYLLVTVYQPLSPLGVSRKLHGSTLRLVRPVVLLLVDPLRLGFSSFRAQLSTIFITYSSCGQSLRLLYVRTERGESLEAFASFI